MIGENSFKAWPAIMGVFLRRNSDHVVGPRAINPALAWLVIRLRVRTSIGRLTACSCAMAKRIEIANRPKTKRQRFSPLTHFTLCAFRSHTWRTSCTHNTLSHTRAENTPFRWLPTYRFSPLERRPREKRNTQRNSRSRTRTHQSNSTTRTATAVSCCFTAHTHTHTSVLVHTPTLPYTSVLVHTPTPTHTHTHTHLFSPNWNARISHHEVFAREREGQGGALAQEKIAVDPWCAAVRCGALHRGQQCVHDQRGFPGRYSLPGGLACRSVGFFCDHISLCSAGSRICRWCSRLSHSRLGSSCSSNCVAHTRLV
jgi:hypothetical protein